MFRWLIRASNYMDLLSCLNDIKKLNVGWLWRKRDVTLTNYCSGISRMLDALTRYSTITELELCRSWSSSIELVQLVRFTHTNRMNRNFCKRNADLFSKSQGIPFLRYSNSNIISFLYGVSLEVKPCYITSIEMQSKMCTALFEGK